jgi:hypothetical protein
MSQQPREKFYPSSPVTTMRHQLGWSQEPSARLKAVLPSSAPPGSQVAVESTFCTFWLNSGRGTPRPQLARFGMGKFSPTKQSGDCEEIANPSTARGRRRRGLAGSRFAGCWTGACSSRKSGLVERAGTSVRAESYIYIDVRSPRRGRRPMILLVVDQPTNGRLLI